MHYSSSPKKYSADITEFLDQKNQEIQNLKTKILGSRVTYEEMEGAKSRLDELKISQNSLERQDFSELKEVLKSSQQTVCELSQKKNMLINKLQQSKTDHEQMQALNSELDAKMEKLKKIENDLKQEGIKIRGRKQKKGSQILELEDENSMRRRQIAVERDISDELDAATHEIQTKLANGEKQLTQTQKANLALREQIREQMSKISSLEHNMDICEVQCELLQEKISHKETSTALLHHKVEHNQQNLHTFAQNKLIFISEKETSSNIHELIQMCTQSYESKHQQQIKCQQEISQINREIAKGMEKVKQIQLEAEKKRATLKQLKEKGAELRSILNSIFKQDSSVLKMLADKKVFEEGVNSEKNLKESILIKSNTTNHTNMKIDKLSAMETSDNFFLTANQSVC